MRRLVVLVLLFLIGIGCTRVFRFTLPPLNYAFWYALLCLPFAAIRPLSQLSRWPRLTGFTLLVPLLLICVLLMVGVTCTISVHERDIEVVDSIEQQGCVVRLMWDIGPPLVSPSLSVWQERFLIPGLKIVKPLDFFDGENPGGKLTSEGIRDVRLRVPPTSGRREEISRVYRLKRWVYF